MLYRTLANLVVVLHLGFVLFVILGGLLALRWPRVAWAHLPAAVWGALIEWRGWICPLTPLENELRRRGGEAGYAGGFVEHYLLPVLYPAGLTRTTQVALGALVVGVNVAIYALVLVRRRRRKLAAVALLALVSTAGNAQSAREAQRDTAPRIVGYLAAWGVRSKGTRIDRLPAERLTHIIYAFGGVSSSGRMILGDSCVDVGRCRNATTRAAAGGNFEQLRLLKALHPHLRLLVAVGGWMGSGRFSDVALTEESRQAFVRSGIDTFIRPWPGLFDGFDIDWEFPVSGGLPGNRERPEDKANLTLLLVEFRKQLDALGAAGGRRYLLTIATSARPRQIANLELPRIAPIVDWINVMTYDYHALSRTAHFNAPLYAPNGDPTPGFDIHSTVRVYRDGGVPSRKIVIGVPFYGRGYSGVAATDSGLFQPASGVAPREWGGEAIDFAVLRRRAPESRGFRRHWHAEARVPWLYNSETKVWISYDDAESVAAKADYAREQGLGGLMVWELGGDDGTLLRTMHERLRARRGPR